MLASPDSALKNALKPPTLLSSALCLPRPCAMVNRLHMPSSFRAPTLFRTRHSLIRLRSFHLSPSPVETAASPSLKSRSITDLNVLPANAAIPLRGSTLVTLAVIASIFFIMSISLAFLGAGIEDPTFRTTLDEVAAASPGVVLIGESVDVDVDEPSITVRWSILACGPEYVLPESAGVHGSEVCGLPSLPLRIFVDNSLEPAATYDPSTIPVNKKTGHRRNIQNLVQFDSDHVLDVHDARLYPFDTYFLTSTLRAVGFSNESIPIQKLAAVDVMSSFNIWITDMESFSKTNQEAIFPSRDMDMHVWRPGSARFFAVLLFAVGWLLTLISVGHVILARRVSGMKPLLKHLVSSGAIVFSIPQLRNSMPDAPGLDGVLIDEIGYFPQMIISSISTIILLLILAVREFDIIGLQAETQHNRSIQLPSTSPHSSTCRSYPKRTFIGSRYPSPNPPSWYSRPPRSPNPDSSLAEVAEWERDRMSRHLAGQFVFPPVSMHRPQTSSQATVRPFHRKTRTMTKIMEAGEAPPFHWANDS